MSSISALPAPSSAQPPSGLAKLRQMLASEAAAIQPIRRIPGEEERKRSEAEAKLDATDDALKGSGRAETDETRARARSAGRSAGGFSIGGTAADGRPVTGAPLPQTALPNAGFVTQSIHQEAMGDGLTIEPWSDAIAAYRRADAGVNTPMLTQVAV
ncbi:hypothetical protein [Azospirillum agricola]|uniref:hypothetical protein n=1 Tax=Azospirillum agricola TaxID=1720247 RepID=UPI000A1CD8DE|nr:hypothetical protein [Azospirillum agricola]